MVALNESVWWDYQIMWDDACNTNVSSTFTVECSRAQLAQLSGGDTLAQQMGLSQLVDACVNGSGGVGYNGGVNTVLASEVAMRHSKGVFHMPMVTVNEFEVRGNIDCEEMTEAGCQVLDAICAGFAEGTLPPQCLWTEPPTPAPTCYVSEEDCAGQCYGRMVVDACGACLTVSDPLFDACVGCDGVAYSGATPDCEQHCQGTYEVNACGYCLDPNNYHSREMFDEYGTDCKGICEGEHYEDQCGECLAPSDPAWDACLEEDGGGEKGGGDGQTRNESTAVIVIAVVSLILLAVAAYFIYRMYTKQRRVDSRMAELASQYQPMDEEQAVQ